MAACKFAFEKFGREPGAFVREEVESWDSEEPVRDQVVYFFVDLVIAIRPPLLTKLPNHCRHGRIRRDGLKVRKKQNIPVAKGDKRPDLLIGMDVLGRVNFGYQEHASPSLFYMAQSRSSGVVSDRRVIPRPIEFDVTS